MVHPGRGMLFSPYPLRPVPRIAACFLCTGLHKSGREDSSSPTRCAPRAPHSGLFPLHGAAHKKNLTLHKVNVRDETVPRYHPSSRHKTAGSLPLNAWLRPILLMLPCSYGKLQWEFQIASGLKEAFSRWPPLSERKCNPLIKPSSSFIYTFTAYLFLTDSHCSESFPSCQVSLPSGNKKKNDIPAQNNGSHMPQS